jgi:hypothetical protein
MLNQIGKFILSILLAFSSCQHSAAVHRRFGTGHGMCYWSFFVSVALALVSGCLSSRGFAPRPALSSLLASY